MQSDNQYTTLKISDGSYPFSLSEDEEKLSGDDWAWLFLRLNPLYRHDYDLQKNTPAALSRRARQDLSLLRRLHGKDAFLDYDSRYFFHDGAVLSESCEWPGKYKPVSLGDYLKRLSEEETLRVQVRDFDCERDYGIAHWFDPTLEELPKLENGLSWFHFLNDPIWAIGDPLIATIEEPITTSVDGMKIVVGYKQRFTRRALEDITAIVGNKDVLNKPKTGFTTKTEMACLISMDGYISPQLDRLLGIAIELQTTENAKRFPAPPVGFEPLILHPYRAATLGIVSLTHQYEDLAYRSSANRKNWLLILIDLKYSLEIQRKEIEATLKTRQDNLIASKKTWFAARERQGRLNSGGNHWLKEALCVLELYLKKPSGRGPINGAGQICDYVYASHLEKTETDKIDSVKKALKLGKKLVESQYMFLVTG